MNRIYRLIWNRERRMLVVCSELASSRRGSAVSTTRERELRCVLGALFIGLLAALHIDTATAATTTDSRMSDMLALADKYAPQPVAVAAPVSIRAEADARVGAAVPAGARLAAAASASVHAPPSMQADAVVASRSTNVSPPSVVPSAREALIAIAQTPPAADRAVPAAASAAVPAAAVPAPAMPVRAQAAVAARAETGAVLAAVLPEAAAPVTARLTAGAAVAMGEAPRAPVPAPVQAAPMALLAGDEHLGLALDLALDADAGLDARTDDHGATAGLAVAANTGAVPGQPDAPPEDGADVDVALLAQRETAQGRGLIGGLVGGIGGVLDNVVGPVVGGVGDVVGGVVDGVVAPVVGGVVGGIGDLVGGILNPVAPQAIPPENPKYPRPFEPNTGLLIGTGGLVGSVGQLIGPTGQSLFGGDGFVRNGNLTVNSANVMQAYAVTNVLGIPVANITPVGTVLDSLGGATTGGSSHLTLIGGVTSDSYIYNINNGNPGGLLGLLLPDDAPDWASRCVNLLGLATVDCWAVNPAQDYQVLVGDGAYANGSKEVVIGANARHELPPQDASEAFPGNGLNDPLDPTGVPTSDYGARLGHSVVVGDSALGTAHAQTILGAEATSSQVNSVALGYRSAADRGPQVGYTAYGLTAAQNSAGEVSIGRAGQERQITHLAAGSADTDAVNVGQLRGAIELIDSVEVFAVRYDDIGGTPDFSRVTLGNGAGPTTLANVADGAVAADSSEAITGGQLHAANLALAGHLGGGAGLDADGNVTAPTYALNEVAVDGTVGSGSYTDVGGAFDSVSTSLANVAQATGELDRLAVRYDVDADGNLVNRVTLAGDGGGAPVGLDNVAAGAVTAVSAEAITGAQLHAANTALAGYLGGGAGVDAAGNVTAPTYALNEVAADGTVGSGSYTDVGGAFDSVSTSLANVAQATDELDRLAVRYDVDADGNAVNRVTLTGDDTGAPVGLDNVAAGAVTAISAEAVTGAQLHAANTALAGYLGGGAGVDAAGNVTAPTYALNEVAVDGTIGSGSYADVGGAFDSVSASLANVAQVTDGLDRLAVRYDVDADGNAVNRVTLTGDNTGAPVGLDNVAAGAVTAISAEAVTGAQLYGANAALAGYLGGGAGLDADGNVTAPTYVLNEITSTGGTTTGSYADVGGALDSLSQSLVNIDGRADTVGRLAVRYDADADGDPTNQITLVGDGSGAPVRLTQLADGAITAISTDAVSGGQLFATHATLAGFFGGSAGFDGDTGQWSAPVFSITSVALDGSGSVADYANVTDAFAAVDASLVNLNQRIDQGGGPGAGSPYVQVNSTQAAASAVGAESVAIGPQARAEGDGSVALGDGAVAGADNSVALGAGSRAETGAQQGYDGAFVEAGSSNSVGEVSVGSSGAERKITNVADGSDRYDAVNVGQLQGGVDYAIDQSRQYTDQQINNINNGGSGMFRVNDSLDRGNPDASGDDSVAGGAGAVAGGSGSTALGNGARADGANSVALGAGSVATRDNTVSVGSAGNERQITDVADATDAHDAVNLRQLQASQQGSLRYDTRSDGTADFSSVTLGAPGGSAPVRVRNVAAGVAGTDAVNVNQLNQAMDWSRQYTDDRFGAVQGDIRRVDNRASAGVAAAMAMASLPQPYLPGRSMISVAGSTFNGESSMAVGIAGVSEGGRWIYRLNGSANSRGDGGVSVGAGFQW